MTRKERIDALIEANRQSKNGNLTYVLLKSNAVITQDTEHAKSLVRKQGYRVYAKCKDGYMIL